MESNTLSFNNKNISYFIYSDTHFGHVNILDYDHRPFTDIKDHDKSLITNWNKVVKDDVIFFLGDFALTSKYYAKSIMERLNGIKFFIKGNHDKKDNIKLFEEFGTLLQPIHKIIIHGHTYILSHYPLESWEGSNAQKSIHIHGHTHGKEIMKLIKNRHNVSANLVNYTPVNMNTFYYEKNKKRN